MTGGVGAGVVRSYEQEMGFIEQLTPYRYRVRPGFVPGMHVPGEFYVNSRLQGLLFEELQAFCARGDHGGFLPAVKQIANVAALPGIVKARARGRGGPRRRVRRSAGHRLHAVATAAPWLALTRSPPPRLPQKSIALPDVHSGYGFAIGARQRRAAIACAPCC